MKQFEFKKERSYSGREQLPVGGYVCQINGARIESNEWGDKLIVGFDVCEGDFAGIFQRDYQNNTNDNKKWRGTFRLNVPKDDGTERDAWSKRAFGNFIWAVQESNPGYVWAWDEKTLKGKKLGVLYRNKEWSMGDRTGWSTEAAGAASIEDVRSGKVKQLKDKPLKNRPVVADAIPETAEDESDLPF